jgi:hypothetical protein
MQEFSAGKPVANRIKKGITVIFVCFVVFVVVVGVAYLGFRPRYFTVAQVWQKRQTLNGQQITVRGYWGFVETEVTVVGCEPRRCDCNTSGANRIGLMDQKMIVPETPTFRVPPKNLTLQILECHGDECAMTCTPIDPNLREEVEIKGRLRIMQADTVYPYLMLDDVQLEVARYNKDGVWLPMPTGTFKVQLPQKK